jgi:PAS domain S-box-containing protein
MPLVNDLKQLAAVAPTGTCRLHCRWRPVLLSVFVVIVALVPTTAQGNQKNVLILTEGHGRVSINWMQSSLRAHFSGSVSFSIVDLDNPRFEEKSYQENLAEAFQAAYANEKLDLVMTIGPTPLQFAVQYRDKMFPGVPIVFMSIDWLPERTWPGVTGVASPMGVQETIDLALRLHPDTQAMAIIGQASGTFGDENWLATERAELLRLHDKVTEIDLIGSPSPELLQRVVELPPHTVILFHLYPQDSKQPSFGAMDVLAAVSRRFPTYSILPHVILGHGGIGGASYDPPTDAKLTGELVARVLSGEKPDNIPVVVNPKVNVSVDWMELQRWNIPESALPPGTIILNREPSLWDRGWKYFVAAIAVILLQTISIFALFWQRARKRRAETELATSEEKFSKTFRHSPLVLAISRTSDSCFVDINDSFEEQVGWKRVEVIGRTAPDLHLWADADQRAKFKDQLQTKGSVRDLEALIRRKDSEIRTFLVSAEVLEVGGEICTLSVGADITERKQAEEMLSTMSRRLIEAQEKERAWIARELHDDFNQRVAMVSVNLECLERDLSGAEVKAKSYTEEIKGQIRELGIDLHALSHRLHSSKLDYLGLEAACKGFCTELSARQNVEISFHSENIPRELSKETSLCLFRVLQEALQNAVKYSGVRNFQVSLIGASGEIELTVRDSGSGFDTEEAISGKGLGLTSMKERLKIVDGLLSIESKPGQGTTIQARVPSSPETAAARASL